MGEKIQSSWRMCWLTQAAPNWDSDRRTTARNEGKARSILALDSHFRLPQALLARWPSCQSSSRQTELIRFDLSLALNYSYLSPNFPRNNLIMHSSRRAPGWVALRRAAQASCAVCRAEAAPSHLSIKAKPPLNTQDLGTLPGLPRTPETPPSHITGLAASVPEPRVLSPTSHS